MEGFMIGRDRVYRFKEGVLYGKHFLQYLFIFIFVTVVSKSTVQQQ